MLLTGSIDPLEYQDWVVVPFVDPRDGSVYDIIDGRVIISLLQPPTSGVVDPNYFDVERQPNDPVYAQVTYHYYVLQTLSGLTQCSDPAVAGFLAAENLTVYSEWTAVGGLAVLLPPGQSVTDAVANWPSQYSSLIASVDPDALCYSDAWPQQPSNDQQFNQQWHLQPNEVTPNYPMHKPYSTDAVAAWLDGTYGNGQAKVAVIDTGVDYGSADLQWRSTPYGVNTGDSKVSTQFRYRYLGGGEPWPDWLNKSQVYASALGHGTCVAGVIAAAVNNDGNGIYDDRDLVGVAPWAMYVPVAAKANAYLNSQGKPASQQSYSAVINALYAVAAIKRLDKYLPYQLYGTAFSVPYYNIEVVNMSFSTKARGTSATNKLLEDLAEHMVLVASAGNDNQHDINIWPAIHPKVMCIAAHGEDGMRVPGTNYQDYVDISAPGSTIYTCDMVGYTTNGLYYKGFVSPDGIPGVDYWGENAWMAGTSFSAPMVSAVAAMIADKYSSMEPDDIVKRIKDGRADLNGAEPNLTCGRLDAYLASH